MKIERIKVIIREELLQTVEEIGCSRLQIIPIGVIHMISGGSTDGDSGRARKAHGRRLENFEVSSQLSCPTDPNISFGREDLKDVVLPHNDPLLVTLTIANYDVARIFVDTGSSVNIIFKETLDQMKLEGFELDPITTELYGFTGHALQPLG
ncbi:uncharacterized protein [Henckelia pumila]|uniref:uncharacterized protein n=1 Tax=Henckelia pumila TaxID=405737 RepID=UPI003C6DF17D